MTLSDLESQVDTDGDSGIGDLESVTQVLDVFIGRGFKEKRRIWLMGVQFFDDVAEIEYV